jgi:hypothetical protein
MTPAQKEASSKIVAEVEEETVNLSVSLFLTSSLTFRDDLSARLTTALAGFSKIGKHVLWGISSCMLDHAKRKATLGEGGMFVSPSKELVLFSALILANSQNKDLSGKDIFELSKKQLTAIGHELPETEPVIPVI